ncbi:hypothetical protein MPER_00245 [Moniliophthora perniciosa FA553]|nr:hypothetical protein MPER_00245 [Moniliophthora perniciosa FA553]
MTIPDSFTLFKPRKAPVLPRTVHVNESRPLDMGEDVVFSSNQVITSKYTLLTFLPVNLAEQFKRFVNIDHPVLSAIQINFAWSGRDLIDYHAWVQGWEGWL